LHCVRCRNLLINFRGIELFRLCTRFEFGGWFERLLRLSGWNLPGRFGRIKLFELRRGDDIRCRSEHLHELRRWDLPDINWRVDLFDVCSGNGVKLPWCIGGRHVRVVLCGVVFFNVGIFRVHGMLSREFCVERRSDELLCVCRRSIRGIVGCFGVFGLSFRNILVGRGHVCLSA